MLILKGLSAGKTTKEIRPEWDAKYGMSEDTWETDVTAAYKMLKKKDASFTENAKEIFLARYSALYEKAVEADDIKTAADIIQKSTKLLGLDVQKVDAKVDAVVEVDWGE